MMSEQPLQRGWSGVAEQTIDLLCEKLSSYCNESELASVREAYEFASRAHAGQTRMSGEPYIIHPLAVAFILADLQLDATGIIAALLHDVVEDTSVTDSSIVQHFGAEAALSLIHI